MNKKHLSYKRTKTSAITLADLLAKEGASLVPTGGLLYELSKSLFKHGKKYFEDRTTLRLEEFHENLLRNEYSNNTIDEFINKEFDIEDYNSLLSSCVQDIENEKTIIYANLLQSLINNKLSNNEKHHFIRATKDLTINDLDFLKKLYINSKFDMMVPGGISEQQKNIVSGAKGLNKISLDKNILYGFIESSENSGEVSFLGEKLIKLIFDKAELKPNSIDGKEWTGIRIVIISYELGDAFQRNSCMTIGNVLRVNNIKYGIHILNKSGEMMQHMYSVGILVVGRNHIDEKYLSSIEKFTKIRPLVRLNTLEESKAIQIEGINFIETFDIDFSDASKASNYIQKLLKERMPK